ncbi:MAG: nuclear transport factor 2 family protein [archaeon]|nr:nuclear transport factor 2 family protein [archaeon]
MTRAEDLISKAVESINKHDIDTLFALYDPHVQYWNPVRQEINGKDALRKVVESVFKAFPNEQIQIKNVLVQGDSAAFEALDSATFTAVLETPRGNIQPTNKSYRVPFLGFLRLNNDGLIAEQRDYYDSLSFFRQLGIELRG